MNQKISKLEMDQETQETELIRSLEDPIKKIEQLREHHVTTYKTTEEVIIYSNFDISTLLSTLDFKTDCKLDREESSVKLSTINSSNHQKKRKEMIHCCVLNDIHYTEQSDGEFVEPQIRSKLLFKTPHEAQRYMKLEVMRTKLFSCLLPDEHVFYSELRNGYAKYRVENDIKLKFTHQNVNIVFRNKMVTNKYSDIEYSSLKLKKLKKIADVLKDSIKVRSFVQKTKELEFLGYFSKGIKQNQYTTEHFNPIVFKILDHIKLNITKSERIFITPGQNFRHMIEIKNKIKNGLPVDYELYDYSVLLHSIMELIKNTNRGLIPEVIYLELLDAYHNLQLGKAFQVVNILIPAMSHEKRMILAMLLDICKLIKDIEETVLCTYADSIHKLAEFVFGDDPHNGKNSHRIKVALLDILAEMNFDHLPEWLLLFDC